MSNKFISDLKQLLLPSVMVANGTVLSVDLDTLFVASSDGPKRFRVINPGAYRKGNRVRFQGEVLLGKLPDETGIPYYSV